MRNRRLSAPPAARSATAPTATIEGCRHEKTDCAAGSAGLQPILTSLCRWAQETPSSETPESPRTPPHRPVRNVSRRLGHKSTVAKITSLRRGVLFRAAVQPGTNSINPLPRVSDFQIVPSAVFKKSPPWTGAPHNEEICSLARNCCGRDGTCHSGIRQNAQEAPQTSSSRALERRINSLNRSAKHKAPRAGLCIVSAYFVGFSNSAFSQCLTKLPYHCR